MPQLRAFQLISLVFAAVLVGCATVPRTDFSSGTREPSVVPGGFGKTVDGQSVRKFTLTNGHGLEAVLTDYGAILVSLKTPDRSGNFANIVLGFDSVTEYAEHNPFFGATVGRYANRIAGGKFTLDGTEYTLATNNAPNHLHGGNVGFDKVIWDAEPFTTEDSAGVIFRYLSRDMEEGYPGNLTCTVTYTLNDDNELAVAYEATTDAPTIVNLTHHSYFNLQGHDSGDVLDHVLLINADHYTPVDETLIPTGAIDPVAGTPLDFTTPHSIGARIEAANGYDHNFVLNKESPGLALAARVVEPDSGRVMEIHTTEPGVQLYTGNFLGGLKGTDSAVYEKHHGFCLEAQHFPDSPNHPHFPSTVLRPGETYEQLTVHKFSVE